LTLPAAIPELLAALALFLEESGKRRRIERIPAAIPASDVNDRRKV